MASEDSAIEPVTALKARSSALIRRARESGRPIVITQNGKAAAVLEGIEAYERNRRALFLLKLLAVGDEELRRGKGVPTPPLSGV